jgi:hypothetical protein
MTPEQKNFYRYLEYHQKDRRQANCQTQATPRPSKNTFWVIMLC